MKLYFTTLLSLLFVTTINSCKNKVEPEKLEPTFIAQPVKISTGFSTCELIEHTVAVYSKYGNIGDNVDSEENRKALLRFLNLYPNFPKNHREALGSMKFDSDYAQSNALYCRWDTQLKRWHFIRIEKKFAYIALYSTTLSLETKDSPTKNDQMINVHHIVIYARDSYNSDLYNRLDGIFE
jgi:hypothetical protein